MASPLSKNLIAGAIGESGALINPTLPPVPLVDGEEAGVKFAAEAGASSLAALRAMSAADLSKAASTSPVGRFSVTLDGYVLPKSPADILAAGTQAHVPLLAGWNSEENNGRTLFGTNAVTAENFKTVLKTIFGARADKAAALYPSATPEDLMASATDLASARFIAFSTWKWLDLQANTSGKPVYRYYYSHPRPAMIAPPAAANGRVAPTPTGAVHSAEIEYAMGNLGTNTVFAWTADDRKVSETMQAYFVNFVKNGDPNGAGLPAWPANTKGSPVQFMHLDVVSHAEPDVHRNRYLLLDQVYSARAR
jgi:para-nitrobenzyl esterase